MRLLTNAVISSWLHISSLYSIESLFFQYETPTIFLGPLMFVLLLGLFIIGGGATILSIVTCFPLISSTLLFRKGILPNVCFSPYIRQT